MGKPAFCICENIGADQLRGTAKLISAFVFAIGIVKSLYYLNPKFQASSHLLWLYSPVCVGLGRKPERWFSHDVAHMAIFIPCEFLAHLDNAQIVKLNSSVYGQLQSSIVHR